MYKSVCLGVTRNEMLLGEEEHGVEGMLRLCALVVGKMKWQEEKDVSARSENDMRLNGCECFGCGDGCAVRIKKWVAWLGEGWSLGWQEQEMVSREDEWLWWLWCWENRNDCGEKFSAGSRKMNGQ